ncbi:PBSX family phage terminase large subunit [Tuberibacillus calidus]|uniref:PBSX family phage terminase large subunit n=1 Tax=Tuberibacillus calidus TaxID=340097 RepID=UPI0003F81018|nr:PBSX family phage terminase large subunit [Tuberibacillus calidus]
MNINISKKVFAPVYLKHHALENTDRYLILYGGAGSGKSVFASQKILFRLLKEKNQRFLVVRKVAATLKNSVYELLKDTISRWGLYPYFTVTKSPLEITCNLNGNKILFVGIDDPEKLKSIAGITSIWVEEATELTQEDFQQLDLRLRGKTKTYKQIIITFNPISEHHWLKKYFFDNTPEHTTIIKTTYLDNPFLDDSYKRTLENLKNKDENYYRIYALGEFGQLGKMVYPNYSIKDFDISLLDNFYYGNDFGFNDPMAWIEVAYDKKAETIYVCREFKKSGLTTSDLAQELKKRMSLRDILICDSAEPDRIEELRRAGFKNARPTKKGRNSINFGIDWIKSRKLIIHPSCVEFIKEIQTYQYMKDNKTNEYLDKPVDANNHLLDALRYALNMEMNKNHRRIGLSKHAFGL